MTIETLPPTPTDTEYRKFHGRYILFPKAGGEPIRVGTGLTKRQLQFALYLEELRRLVGSESFFRLNELREIKLIEKINMSS